MTKVENSMKVFHGSMIEMESNWSDLKDSVEFQGHEIDDLKKEAIPAVQARCDDNQKRALDSILETKVWLRKWNLMVYNVPGSGDETAAETRKKLREVLQTGLGINDSIPLAAAHRLPKTNNKDAPPPIIVRFLDLDDRDNVMSKARNLKNSEVYKKVGFVPDIPPELRGRRASLLRMRAQLPPDQRAKAKLVYPKKPPYILLKAGRGTIEAD